MLFSAWWWCKHQVVSCVVNGDMALLSSSYMFTIGEGCMFCTCGADVAYMYSSMHVTSFLQVEPCSVFLHSGVNALVSMKAAT